jgi:hypothetical protein
MHACIIPHASKADRQSRTPIYANIR